MVANLEKSVVCQLIVLYAKGWLVRDSDFTSLRLLLSKYGYGWDNMSKNELYDVLILKFSDIQECMYANGFKGYNISTANLLQTIEHKLSWDDKLTRVDASILSIMSILSQVEFKLAKPNFREIGMRNYSLNKKGMTHTEMDRILSEYKWEYEMDVCGSVITIKTINN